MSNLELRDKRPLSPHLQIYKPIPTMVMSIVHRITGVGLYFGTLLFAVWVLTAATSKENFESVNWMFGTFIGQLMLFGFTWTLMHHLAGGLRHFLWDTGRGFEKHFSTKLAWATLAFSLVTTVVIWIIAYSVR